MNFTIKVKWCCTVYLQCYCWFSVFMFQIFCTLYYFLYLFIFSKMLFIAFIKHNMFINKTNSVKC